MENYGKDWVDSAESWIKFVDQGDLNRNLLLDPVMLNFCEDIAGKNVLDVGCGEGRFCRMLSKRGAITTGIDPIGKMIETAQERHSTGIYLQQGAESLSFSENSFDFVVSYITLIDILDYKKAIFEMARVTKPGGKILVANVSAFATAKLGVQDKNEQGERLYDKSNHYMAERSEWTEWQGLGVWQHHRPLSWIFQAFLQCDLVLKEFIEPIASAEVMEKFPSFFEEDLISPNFYVMLWQK